MVRLKQVEFHRYEYRWNQSQFHYGSIKTEYNIKNGIEVIRSQFHYGSIKT